MLLAAILVSVVSAVGLTASGTSSHAVGGDSRSVTGREPGPATAAVPSARARSAGLAGKAADLPAPGGGASSGAEVAHGQGEPGQPEPGRPQRAAPIVGGQTATVGTTLPASNGPGGPMPGLGGEVRGRPAEAGISQTPSATEPHWACPHGPCEAIVDPPAVRMSGRWALPAGGPLLEGGGEKGGFDPQDLGSAYDIPSAGGSTQTIALVDAYGYRAAESDLATYRSRYGLAACTSAGGCFTKVNEAGEEANYPEATGKSEEKSEGEWDVEAALDLDMASAACPECHILLVEATIPSVADLAAAVDTAARLGATEISNSYGIAEEDCESGNCEEYGAAYDHPGAVVTASAGDSGYDNSAAFEKSPSFPATSPSVVAVGGTSLKKAANARGWSEEVWRRSGGGCSGSEPKPTWQRDTGCANRTDNDVAAVADPETPVSVYDSAEGWIDVGGTSVSAPLVAGIEAHASDYTRSLPGAAAFYQDPGALFDVTVGSNPRRAAAGECRPPAGGAEYLCNAEVGYDGPTGNGTPDGPLQLAGGPPSVATDTATAVTGGAATLNGTVGPNDFETHYHFEYIADAAYQENLASGRDGFAGAAQAPEPDASAGSGRLTEEVSQPVAGLTPDATYHYRLVATNDQGTGEGEDMPFTTAPPTVTRLQPESGPSVGGTTVTISGTNFAGATQVRFGAAAAASFTVESETSISAVSPAGAGVVDVTVTTPAGGSAIGSADEYLYTQGPEFTGGGESGEGSFGGSVALSADGDTALIGGSGDDGDAGAVWVFTRSDGAWSQQGPKLVGDCTGSCSGEGSGEIGDGSFGNVVALSADGDTALIGAGWDDGGVGSGAAAGAAWVFTRSDGTWAQQGPKLDGDCTGNCAGEGTGAEGPAGFGRGVALSADGDTALIGGPRDAEGEGAVWVFTRSDGAWSQQGPKLVGDCTGNCSGEGSGEGPIGIGGFGASVALSADGDTALIGGDTDDAFKGAVWVFTRAGGAWAQQGAKLTPNDEIGLSEFGGSVALSADGDTALVGGGGDNGDGHNGEAGATWVFTRSGGAWTQQTKLVGDCTSNCAGEGTGAEGPAGFGRSVALSADGDAALIGGPADNETGAVWLFTRSGRAWVQQGQKLTAAGQGSRESLDGRFGASVALSSEGTAALIGSPGLRGEAGAAWALAFPPIPTVTEVEPSAGPAAGGTPVTITGTNFTAATTVDFGAAQATDVEVKSATEVTAVSPPGAGAVDVTMSTPDRTSPAGTADQFTYETPPPPTRTISVSPDGAGSVSASSGAIQGCASGGGTCAGAYEEAATVILTATPAPHNQVSWEGCTSSSGDSCTVVVGKSDVAVVATFTTITHTLTVRAGGGASGTVTSAPAGIDCGATCAAAFVEGTEAILTATPAKGATFGGWSGGGCSGTGACRLTIGAADETVNADFERVPPVPSVPARLRIRSARSKALPSGPRIAVAGTIAAAARGSVRVTAGVRLGRRRVTATGRARIGDGRWDARLALPSARRHPKAPIVVTARFAGSPGVRSGHARRRVRAR